MEGATHLHLDVLASAEAVELLGRLAGRERLAAERGAAVEVAHLCGHLPLALRIAGARLAARPGWPVGVVAERLADAQRRLDELELGEIGVRASFQVSYQQLCDGPDALDQAAAEAFGLGRSWCDGRQCSMSASAADQRCDLIGSKRGGLSAASRGRLGLVLRPPSYRPLQRRQRPGDLRLNVAPRPPRGMWPAVGALLSSPM